MARFRTIRLSPKRSFVNRRRTDRCDRDDRVGLALPNVSGGHPSEFEVCRSGGHDWVLRGEFAKRVFIVCLHYREAVRGLVGEDWAEHNHVAALEMRGPVLGVPAHDLPLGVGQGLSEVMAWRNEAQDEGWHAADSTPATRPRQPVRSRVGGSRADSRCAETPTCLGTVGDEANALTRLLRRQSAYPVISGRTGGESAPSGRARLPWEAFGRQPAAAGCAAATSTDFEPGSRPSTYSNGYAISGKGVTCRSRAARDSVVSRHQSSVLSSDVAERAGRAIASVATSRPAPAIGAIEARQRDRRRRAVRAIGFQTAGRGEAGRLRAMSRSMSAENIARSLIDAFCAIDTQRMRLLLADDLKAYITNRDGGVDEVGADEYVGRVAAIDLSSAQFRVDVTQAIAPRPDMVIVMVEVNAAEAAGRFIIMLRTVSSCATAWSSSGGWWRHCQPTATDSGLRSQGMSAKPPNRGNSRDLGNCCLAWRACRAAMRAKRTCLPSRWAIDEEFGVGCGHFGSNCSLCRTQRPTARSRAQRIGVTALPGRSRRPRLRVRGGWLPLPRAKRSHGGGRG